MPPYGELIAIHDRFFAETWGGDPEMVDSELVAAYRLNAANCPEPLGMIRGAGTFCRASPNFSVISASLNQA